MLFTSKRDQDLGAFYNQLTDVSLAESTDRKDDVQLVILVCHFEMTEELLRLQPIMCDTNMHVRTSWILTTDISGSCEQKQLFHQLTR